MADISIFKRLKKLFSTDVIIRNTGGKKLKVVDTSRIQYATDRNSLRDRFNRLRSSTYNLHNRDMSMAYQAARLELFRDYDIMDMDPILASALDIYADECCTESELGKVLTIRSDDDNIRAILENLFYEILNVEFNLWSWTRNMVKYGDFFLKMEISPEYGVYSVQPLSAYEITRIEGLDPENKNYVKFQHDGAFGGMEYENYEIAHFRLLSDSNFLPYGRSQIEPARRVWKQLSLMEDAMLIHRIMRAPERRIFYVDIGNIPPSEVDTYMERLINKMKKVPFIDERTGDYNLRFNLQNMIEDFYLPVRGSDSGTRIENLAGLEWTGIDDLEYVKNKMMAALKIPKAFLGYEEGLCFSPDTKIPLLNGQEKTAKELIADFENGIENEVYSLDEETHKFVPGKIEWAGMTRLNAEVVKVTLDNDEEIICTPDHTFMTRDGDWVEAQNLTKSQSLMPLYRENKILYGKSDYEHVYHPGTNKWELSHKIVDRDTSGELIQTCYDDNGKFIREDMKVVHHVNFNRFDNSSTNLQRVTWGEHRKIHNENVYKTICSPEAIAYKKSPEFAKKKSAERIKFIAENPDESERLKKNLAQYTMSPKELSDVCKLSWVNNENRVKSLISANKAHNKATLMQSAARKARGFNNELPTFNDIDEFVNSNGWGVESIMKALGCGKNYVYRTIRKNYGNTNEYIKSKNKVLNHKVKSVEFLTEKIDTCDITVTKHHNFATSAGVIIHNSGKATLAAEDVRFARTIQRVQKIIVSELTKIAIIHLYVQGYTDASLVNFELKLTNPSTIFEQEKVALWGDKMNVAGDMYERKFFSKRWVMEHIFDMSKDEQDEIAAELVNDTKSNYRLTSIEEDGTDPTSNIPKVGADAGGDSDGEGGGDDFGGGGFGGGMDDFGGDDFGGDELFEGSVPEPGEDNRPADVKKDQDVPTKNHTNQTVDGKRSDKDRLGYTEDPLGKNETNVTPETEKREDDRFSVPGKLGMSMTNELRSIDAKFKNKDKTKRSLLDEGNILED